MSDSVREFFRRRPVVTVVLALAAIGGAVYYAVTSSHTKTAVLSGFYDEATGEGVERSIRDVPPLKGKGGEMTVVRAGYRTEADGARKLAYLEKYSDQAKAEVEKHLRGEAEGPPNIPPDGHLVRRPEPGSPWAPINSRQGREIVTGVP